MKLDGTHAVYWDADGSVHVWLTAGAEAILARTVPSIGRVSVRGVDRVEALDELLARYGLMLTSDDPAGPALGDGVLFAAEPLGPRRAARELLTL